MTQANPQLITTGASSWASPDLIRARRLAVKCESIAAAGKSWAIILAGRLGSQKPMTPAATDVAVSMAREIADAADLLHATSQALQAHLKHPLRS
jgi:hypothetical protein